MNILTDPFHENKVLMWVVITTILLLFAINGFEVSLILFQSCLLETQLWKDFYTLTNSILVNIVAAYVFFILVVVIPEQRKKRIVKTHFAQVFRDFKLILIDIFLQAADLQQYHSESEKLLDIKCFKEFFDQSDMRAGDARNHYWYAVMNGMQRNEYYVEEILTQLEVLRQEILYVLSSLEITDQEVFDFLKRLSHILFTHRKVSTNYDEVEYLADFLWQVFSGWSFISRYSDKDSIEEIISKL